MLAALYLWSRHRSIACPKYCRTFLKKESFAGQACTRELLQHYHWHTGWRSDIAKMVRKELTETFEEMKCIDGSSFHIIGCALVLSRSSLRSFLRHELFQSTFTSTTLSARFIHLISIECFSQVFSVRVRRAWGGRTFLTWKWTLLQSVGINVSLPNGMLSALFSSASSLLSFPLKCTWMMVSSRSLPVWDATYFKTKPISGRFVVWSVAALPRHWQMNGVFVDVHFR